MFISVHFPAINWQVLAVVVVFQIRAYSLQVSVVKSSSSTGFSRDLNCNGNLRLLSSPGVTSAAEFYLGVLFRKALGRLLFVISIIIFIVVFNGFNVYFNLLLVFNS